MAKPREHNRSRNDDSDAPGPARGGARRGVPWVRGLVFIIAGAIVVVLTRDWDSTCPVPAPVVDGDASPMAPATNGLAESAISATNRAEGAFPSIEELGEEWPDVYTEMGDRLSVAGRHGEAITLYERVLWDHPDKLDVRFNLAIALAAAGLTDEAEAAYRKVIAADDQYVEAHHNLGNLLVRQNRIDEGIQHLRRVMEISPDYHLIHGNLGHALARKGNLTEARDLFLTALELDPEYIDAHFNLANTYMLLKEPEKARAHFQEILNIDPDFQLARKAMEAFEKFDKLREESQDPEVDPVK